MTTLISAALALVFAGVASLLFDRQRSGERSWGPARPHREPEMWLEVRAGPNKGEWFSLTNDPLTIGRSAGNLLGLDDQNVAYQHAMIYPIQGGWFIKDMAEQGYLTTINEIPLRQGSVRLNHGDTVVVGPYRFRTHFAAPDASVPVRPVEKELRPPTIIVPQQPKQAVGEGEDAPLFESSTTQMSSMSKMHGGTKWRRPPTRDELKRVVTFLEDLDESVDLKSSQDNNPQP